jgi:uncharacterized protein YndB with AHSA1/START domain
MTTNPQFTVMRRLAATPDEVYEAWLDPQALAEWMCPHPARPRRVELDPRVGGRYRFDIDDGPAALVVTGRYLALDPGRLLRFTWSCDTWADPAVESVVTVTLTARGDECDLVLTHARLPAEQVPNHRAGWTAIVEQLDAWLATSAP